MKETVMFLFSSFWVWLGALILISALCSGIAEIIRAIRPKQEVKAYKIGERWSITVTGGSSRAVADMIAEFNAGFYEDEDADTEGAV